LATRNILSRITERIGSGEESVAPGSGKCDGSGGCDIPGAVGGIPGVCCCAATGSVLRAPPTISITTTAAHAAPVFIAGLHK
jgi:hypothetical protein